MSAEVDEMQRPPAGEPSLLEIAGVLLRWRSLTIWLPIALVILTGVVSLLLPREYTATATFLPQRSQSALGRLAGLAAQFGVAVPGQDPGQSPEFYADLIVSRELLARMVTDSFDARADGRLIPLVELLNAKGRSSAGREQDAVRRLGRRLAVSADPKTSVVTLQVTTRWPGVSAAIAARVLSEVNRFDLNIRQSQASAERLFVEERLKAAKDDLRVAEDRSAAFLVSNREYRNSPILQFQYDRLSRDVAAHQEVVTTLQQNYEQARIDEVRDTPRVTEIEHPVVPARPDSRHLVLRLILAGLVGVVLGWPAAMGAEHVRRVRQVRSGEVEALLSQARQVLPAWWRAKRRG
jgi:uncharacterized protein involved in exopolysaccharide biosynthesis